jgi:type I restriction enzyme S subunit
MSEVAQAPHSSPDGRIPQLRFPEFDGVWESRLLKDAVKINPRSGELPDEFIYIDLESVKKGYLIKETQINKIGAPSRAQRLLNKNDVIFQTVRPYQKNNYFFNLDGDYVASTGYAQLRVLNSPEFLYQALHTDRFVYDVMARSTGTSYPAINSTDLSKIKLNLPTKPEQQKIAAFLTAVDTKIEQLSTKQVLLGEYKKGLMQQIFSQAIRFKADDGCDFPDWEEKKLGDILDYEQPTNYIVDSTEYDNSFDMPVLTAGKSFVLGYTNETHKVFENIPVIIFDDFTTANKYVDFPFKVKSSAMKILKPKDSFVNIRLIFEFIQMLNFPIGEHKRYWISEYQDLKIPFPSFEEQTKIASFLSSIDNKIEQVGKQLDESKQFKKALLQQMFV